MEAYLPNPDKPSFYFRPRDFDIAKDDFFMIRVYPCITYSQYWDEAGQLQPSARLSSEGDESDEMKFTFWGTLILVFAAVGGDLLMIGLPALGVPF